MGFILSSCATIINTKFTTINIYPDSDSVKLIIGKDSVYDLPLTLKVPRSYDDLNLCFVKDSLIDSLSIESKVSPEFKFGNIPAGFLYFSPIAYMIDAKGKQKIYTYPSSIKVNSSDNSKLSYSKYKQNKKGFANVMLSFPYFSNFEYDNGIEEVGYERYKGLIITGNYYYAKRAYLSISSGFTGKNDIPILVMDIEWGDTIINSRASFVKLNNFHDFDFYNYQNKIKTELHVGYGLSYSRFNYKRILNDTINDWKTDYNYGVNMVGLSFETKLVINNYFFLGVSWIPNQYDLDRKKWKGTNFVYFDFGAVIPINYKPMKKLKVIENK